MSGVEPWDNVTAERILCSACRAPLVPGGKFCGACGASTSDAGLSQEGAFWRRWPRITVPLVAALAVLAPLVVVLWGEPVNHQQGSNLAAWIQGGNVQRTFEYGGPGPFQQPTLLWQLDVPGTGVSSEPAVVDGIAYFGTDAGTVYAVDAASGAEKWQISTGGRIANGPTVMDDTVYVGSFDHHIYALDVRSGLRLVVCAGVTRRVNGSAGPQPSTPGSSSSAVTRTLGCTQ